jgi:hypothetical protein
MRYILEVDIDDDWVAGGWEPNQDMLDKLAEELCPAAYDGGEIFIRVISGPDQEEVAYMREEFLKQEEEWRLHFPELNKSEG